MPVWPKVKIGGVEASVVPDEVAEQATLIVCVPWEGPHYFDDDVRAICAGCGRAVRHRPYAPKQPPKVCVSCVPDWVDATRH